MNPIPDDPIIACIERTGYPPWMQDGEPDEAVELPESLSVDDDDEFYYRYIRLTI